MADTKPASVVVWASDANVSAGPESGQPTKVDPAGAVAQGAVAGRAAPARWYNFILNHFSLWAAYLNDLHNQDQFLGADYTWEGEHVFNEPTVFNGNVGVNGGMAITVLYAEELAASISSGSGNVLALGEFLYCDPTAAPTPKPRTVMVNLATATCDAGSGGVLSAVFDMTLGGWTFREASGAVSFPLFAPRGSALLSCRVGVHNPTGGSKTFTATAFGLVANKTTPGSPSGAGLDSATSSVAAGVGAIYNLDLTGVTVDNSTSNYYLKVEGELGAKIMWIEFNYLDAGPRNG